MRADPRLLGYLTRSLSYEVGSVLQYMVDAQQCSQWQSHSYAKQFRESVQHELEHIALLVDALVKLGVSPAVPGLPSVRLCQTVRQMMYTNAELESRVIQHYEDALQYCIRRGDETHESLFANILNDETSHLEQLDSQTQFLRSTED